MSKLILIGLLFSGLNLYSQSRLDKDAAAKQAFMNLHFFADGRGMMMMPQLINIYEKLSQTSFGRNQINSILKDRWGFVIQNEKPSGLFKVKYKNLDIGALGCVACHSGKAAGVFVPGLGNKNIDVLKIGREVWLIEKLVSELRIKLDKSEDFKEAEKFALNFANTLGIKEIGNLTQGLVPVSFIKTWFYKQAGLEYPLTMNRGAVKVPSLWGYGVKRSFGQFSDGFGVGKLPGWAIAVELTAGQTPETVKSYLPKVEAAENVLGDLLPPKYPFDVDQNRAQLGKAVFEKTCAKCHGTYELDSEGLSVYKVPKWIPIHVVKTDSDRLDTVTPEFLQLVDTNPLKDILQHNNYGRGYFSPRLEGVWARFPYLHNGSVPSVRALLTKPENRPEFFSLADAGEFHRFDPVNLGLTMPLKGTLEFAKFEQYAKAGVRWVYSTKRIGQSSQGHPFGIDLSETEKDQIIEYLKTL